LTKEQCASLASLPIWTTEEDRHRALSYADRHFTGVRDAIAAVHAGQPTPANLGVLLAVARYEEAGWMPDGCFDKWRRWGSLGTEKLEVNALVEWLGDFERSLQSTLTGRELDMELRCKELDACAAERLAAAKHAHNELHAQRRMRILARLSVGDTTGARQIERSMPAGPARDQIDAMIYEDEDRARAAKRNAMVAEPVRAAKLP
jgi:hypothetical protein